MLYNKICANCKKFIITSDIQNKKQMTEWLMSNCILQRNSKEPKQHGYQQFLMLFQRIINYSSTSKHKTVDWSWRNIQGDESDAPHWVYAKGIGTGYTKAKDLTSIQLRFNEEMKTRAVDYYKVMFFNNAQECLLRNPILRMVLTSDYGSGKNLIHYYINAI